MNKAEQTVKRMQKDTGFRRAVCLHSHYWFFLTYFTRFLKFPCAEMHKQMLYFSGMMYATKMIVLGFPQCGKSLIHSYSLPLWSIIKGNVKTVVIVVNGAKEKRQFRDRFDRELMFNQGLKKDFKLRCRRKGFHFFFPDFQAQIYIADLQEEYQLDAIIGQTPDLVIVDPLQPFKKDEWRKIKSILVHILENVGNEKTRKIIVGRGDGKDGPLNQLAHEMHESEEKRCLPAFYPFCDADSEVPAWEARFNDSKSIFDELNKPASKEEFFFEYFLASEVPEIPLHISERQEDDTYPVSLDQWTSLSNEAKENIASVFFVPYKGESCEALVLWGIKTKTGVFIYQGIEWRGESLGFDINSELKDLPEKLKKVNPNSDIHLYGDRGDAFSDDICHLFSLDCAHSNTCAVRHEPIVRKKICEEGISSGKIKFKPAFAKVIKAEIETGTEGSMRWFNHLPLVLRESSLGPTIFTVTHSAKKA